MTTIIQEMHRDRLASRTLHRMCLGLNPGPGNFIRLNQCLKEGLASILVSIFAGNSESLFTLGFTPVDRTTTVMTTIIHEMHQDRSAARTSHKKLLTL